MISKVLLQIYKPGIKPLITFLNVQNYLTVVRRYCYSPAVGTATNIAQQLVVEADFRKNIYRNNWRLNVSLILTFSLRQLYFRYLRYSYKLNQFQFWRNDNNFQQLFYCVHYPYARVSLAKHRQTKQFSWLTNIIAN